MNTSTNRAKRKLTPKERVLARWPAARLEIDEGMGHAITVTRRRYIYIIATGRTTAACWRAAARYL